MSNRKGDQKSGDQESRKRSLVENTKSSTSPKKAIGGRNYIRKLNPDHDSKGRCIYPQGIKDPLVKRCPFDGCEYEGPSPDFTKTHFRHHPNHNKFECHNPDCNFVGQCKEMTEHYKKTHRDHWDRSKVYYNFEVVRKRNEERRKKNYEERQRKVMSPSQTPKNTKSTKTVLGRKTSTATNSTVQDSATSGPSQSCRRSPAKKRKLSETSTTSGSTSTDSESLEVRRVHKKALTGFPKQDEEGRDKESKRLNTLRSAFRRTYPLVKSCFFPGCNFKGKHADFFGKHFMEFPAHYKLIVHTSGNGTGAIHRTCDAALTTDRFSQTSKYSKERDIGDNLPVSTSANTEESVPEASTTALNATVQGSKTDGPAQSSKTSSSAKMPEVAVTSAESASTSSIESLPVVNRESSCSAEQLRETLTAVEKEMLEMFPVAPASSNQTEKNEQRCLECKVREKTIETQNAEITALKEQLHHLEEKEDIWNTEAFFQLNVDVGISGIEMCASESDLLQLKQNQAINVLFLHTMASQLFSQQDDHHLLDANFLFCDIENKKEDLAGWETTRVRFHNYNEHLPSARTGVHYIIVRQASHFWLIQLILKEAKVVVYEDGHVDPTEIDKVVKGLLKLLEWKYREVEEWSVRRTASPNMNENDCGPWVLIILEALLRGEDPSNIPFQTAEGMATYRMTWLRRILEQYELGQFLIYKLGKEEDILASLEQKQNLRTKYEKLKEELEGKDKNSVKSTIRKFEDQVKENGIIKFQLEKASQDFMPYTFLIK